MPEGMNVEVAHKLSETEHRPPGDHRGWREASEIVEVILLAIVAVATAWSGYQAARWDGKQAFLYGTASRERIEADASLTLGGQQKLLDVTTFNTWIVESRFGKDQVADQNGSGIQNGMKILGLCIFHTVEIVNPNAGIHDKHG